MRSHVDATPIKVIKRLILNTVLILTVAFFLFHSPSITDHIESDDKVVKFGHLRSIFCQAFAPLDEQSKCFCVCAVEIFNIRATHTAMKAHYANPGITCGPSTLWHNRNTVGPNGPRSVNTSLLPRAQQKISTICKYTSEFKGKTVSSLPFLCLDAQV